MLSLPATGSAAFHATAHGGRGTDRRLGHATQRSAARSERLEPAQPARRRSQRPGSVDSPDRRRFALDRVVVDHGRTPAHKGATKRSEMVSSSNCRVIISSRRRGCTYRSNSRAQGKRRARLTCWQIRTPDTSTGVRRFSDRTSPCCDVAGWARVSGDGRARAIGGHLLENSVVGGRTPRRVRADSPTCSGSRPTRWSS